MGQNSTTILVPVIKNKAQDLLDLLAEIKDDLEQGNLPQFEELNIIHYARWVVIDHGKSWIDDPDERTPKLLFVIDYDGSETDLLQRLGTDAANLLDKVYSLCEHFPISEKRNPASRLTYLANHTIKDAAVYIGAPGRTVQQIKEERNLRNFIRAHLDSKTWDNLSAQAIHQEIKKEVLSKEAFLFLNEKTKMPGINWLGLVFLGLVLLVLLPLILVWVLFIHFFYERKDENFTRKRSQLDDEFMTELEKYEDFKNQNQFTQLVDMKEGNARLITIRGMFLLSRSLIRFVFVQGKLMGIPTIHFAKWVLFDNNKRVLFFSNFDGSWQQYLGDFIDNSGWGLTGIFSNTKVFPKTNFLMTGGAYDEERFLAWSRNSELVTNVWYASYPDLSIKNVNNNTKIRIQLMKALSERQAAKFLKLI
ncbi:hypothetical protein [Cyclobacterium jeungdonense]|uniref:Uncharacterized protein n=1 Tax=Cyclobacterium jeungdonense TaxID=708087 RepID=A0ABT8C4V1_9BACT|nr:hypothetical protein [Cyclobacterium jeungdonense]MDN3687127.1 hypothetical protein [Cyclobacterium jeungdonense]